MEKQGIIVAKCIYVQPWNKTIDFKHIKVQPSIVYTTGKKDVRQGSFMFYL